MTETTVAVDEIPRFKAPDPEKQKEAPKRVTAFYIGDVEYTALAEPSGDIALTYMELVTERSNFAGLRANAFLMNAVLGPENYADLKAALASTDEGTDELKKLIEATQRRVFMALDPKAEKQSQEPSGDNTDG